MRRLLAPTLLLLLLASAPAARAVPITGYAIGSITENLSNASPENSVQPYRFAVGEAVYLRFTYDLDPPRPPIPNDPVDIGIALDAAYGYHLRLDSGPGTRASGAEDGGTLSLNLSSPPGRTLELRFIGDAGTIYFSYDQGAATEGFRASLVRVADDSTFPAPEPSTLALGLVGAGLMGVARIRRRVV